MPIVMIVLYCLIAVVLLFAITFHDELLNERQRCSKLSKSLTVIEGGKSKVRRRL